jgi:glycosyltransferase involved in cell wall biosynthesis
VTTSALVTVVIPTRNRSRLLRDSLSSVQRQTMRDLAIIVVDDGSNDDTGGLVAGVAGDDPRVRLLRQEHGGAAAARNHGLAGARGRWIAFLDDDDLFAPDGLESLLEGSSSPAVAGRALRFTAPSGTDPAALRSDPEQYSVGPWPPVHVPSPVTLKDLLVAPRIPIDAGLFDRAAVLQAGSFDTARSAAEDYDLWLRIARIGSIRTIDRTVAFCRWHGAQTSADQLLHSRETRRVLERFVEADPEAIRLLGRRGFRRRVAGLFREEAYELCVLGRGREAARAAVRGLAHCPGDLRLWTYLALTAFPAVFRRLTAANRRR